MTVSLTSSLASNQWSSNALLFTQKGDYVEFSFTLSSVEAANFNGSTAFGRVSLSTIGGPTGYLALYVNGKLANSVGASNADFYTLGTGVNLQGPWHPSFFIEGVNTVRVLNLTDVDVYLDWFSLDPWGWSYLHNTTSHSVKPAWFDGHTNNFTTYPSPSGYAEPMLVFRSPDYESAGFAYESKVNVTWTPTEAGFAGEVSVSAVDLGAPTPSGEVAVVYSYGLTDYFTTPVALSGGLANVSFDAEAFNDGHYVAVRFLAGSDHYVYETSETTGDTDIIVLVPRGVISASVGNLNPQAGESVEFTSPSFYVTDLSWSLDGTGGYFTATENPTYWTYVSGGEAEVFASIPPSVESGYETTIGHDVSNLGYQTLSFIINVEGTITGVDSNVDFSWTQPTSTGAANMVFADSISRTEVRAVSHGLTDLLNSETPTVYTYSSFGGPDYFVVPSGVYEIEVTAYGGNGAADPSFGPNQGMGGFIQCTVPVTPGEVLEINVGGNGSDGSMTAPSGPPIGYTNYVEGDAGGGWNGGGHGGFSSSGTQTSGGGGGATDIRRGTYSLAERLVVAGGGGGGGRTYVTGAGAPGGNAQYPDASGGSNGATLDNVSGTIGAGGGTQSAGGVGGSDSSPFLPSAPSGTLGQGGNGQGRWYYDGAFNSRGEYCGGGGGGGWYGGGGGTGTSNAGGAGSNGYLSSAGVVLIPNSETTARTTREEPLLTISVVGGNGGSRFYRSYIPYLTADAMRITFAVLGNSDEPGQLAHDDGFAEDGVGSATVYVHINGEQIYQFHIYTDDIKLCSLVVADGSLYTEGPGVSLNIGDPAMVELYVRKYDTGNLAENKITVIPQSIVVATSAFLGAGGLVVAEERDMAIWPYRLFPPGIS